jgi:ATP-dependent Clp protease ATP-binding subunit ClpA
MPLLALQTRQIVQRLSDGGVLTELLLTPEFSVHAASRAAAERMLSLAVIRQLAQRELRALAERDGLAKSQLRLTWTDELVNWLALAGCHARYSARPL